MLELSPQLWNWYVMFFISMGGMLAITISLGAGLLTVDWCYLCAKRIEQKPVPVKFSGAILNLTRFRGLVIGVVLAPVCAIISYYVLFFSLMKLAPQPIDAPPVDFGPAGFEEQMGASASLVLYIIGITLMLMGAVFYSLCLYAQKAEPSSKPAGLLKRFLRRYYRDNLLVGGLLVLLACPAVVYLLYDLAWLVLVVAPSARRAVMQIAFPDAGKFYMASVTLLASWLIVILFVPAVVLLFRGELLSWKYVLRNPAMGRIFERRIKWAALSVLGGGGCLITHYASAWILRTAVSTCLR